MFQFQTFQIGKNSRLKFFFVQTNFGSKQVLFQKNWGQKISSNNWSKKIVCQKRNWSKNHWLKNKHDTVVWGSVRTDYFVAHIFNHQMTVLIQLYLTNYLLFSKYCLVFNSLFFHILFLFLFFIFCFLVTSFFLFFIFCCIFVQLGPKLQSSAQVLARSRTLYSLCYPPTTTTTHPPKTF